MRSDFSNLITAIALLKGAAPQHSSARPLSETELRTIAAEAAAALQVVVKLELAGVDLEELYRQSVVSKKPQLQMIERLMTGPNKRTRRAAARFVSWWFTGNTEATEDLRVRSAVATRRKKRNRA